MLRRFDAIRGDKTFDLADHPGVKKLWFMCHCRRLVDTAYRLSEFGGSYQMILDTNGPKVMESEKCIDYAHNVVQQKDMKLSAFFPN
ncbi:hypothetical protein V6N13_144926 [Hibiscus sabdariffa]|uniref:Uncharacterized protein n=1 Tax=Hibiscus sabdariffa TaxID=183260 RepID=A0ABR2FLY7_9ROSI